MRRRLPVCYRSQSVATSLGQQMSELPGSDAATRPLHGGARGPSAAARDRDRAVAGQPHRRGTPPGPMPRRWGSLPGRTGILIVISGAALGALVTAATGSAPGLALDVFVIGATAAAVLAVRPRSVYLIIPVPALSYLVAATAAGLVDIHGQAAGASLATLAVGAAQWMASGFLAMTAATLLAIAAAVARWSLRRYGPRGPGYPPSNAGAGRPRHRARDTDDPAAAGPPRVPSPRPGEGPRHPRAAGGRRPPYAADRLDL
jgi:hypothetical protein